MGEAENELSAQADGDRWRSYPPFYQHLGLQLESLNGGKCVARLPYAKHFGNSRGEVHGSIVASVLDITLTSSCARAPA